MSGSREGSAYPPVKDRVRYKDFPGFRVALSKTSDISWICVFVYGIKPLCTIDSYSDNFES